MSKIEGKTDQFTVLYSVAGVLMAFVILAGVWVIGRFVIIRFDRIRGLGDEPLQLIVYELIIPGIAGFIAIFMSSMIRKSHPVAVFSALAMFLAFGEFFTILVVKTEGVAAHGGLFKTFLVIMSPIAVLAGGTLAFKKAQKFRSEETDQ